MSNRVEEMARDVLQAQRLSITQNLGWLAAALAASAEEARHEAADLLEDLARDMHETGTPEQRALIRGAIAAYRSGAAAIRGREEGRDE